MMKKVQILVVVVMLGLLTACGNAGSEGKGKVSKDKTSNVSKNKAAEVTVEGGSFIDLFGGDSDDEQEYIALNLKVKNTSKEKMFLWDESFYLTEKGDDEKIQATRPDYDSELKEFSGDVASGKSLSGTVVFEVDSSEKYTLVFSTNSYDDKGNSLGDVELDLDLSKYEKTKEKLSEPQKALQAYIDVVLLQKENEEYEKLVGNDSEADIAMVKKEYIKDMKDTFYKFRPSDEEYDKAFASYVANQKEAIELELTPAGNVGERAKVEVSFKGVSEREVSELIREFKDEYYEKNDDYDTGKQEEFAFSKLEEIYSEAEIGEPRNDIFITMTKKDDKWVIDFKSDNAYENKDLLKAFLGNVD